MLKRSHVLLLGGLAAFVSNSFLCGADEDTSQQRIKFTESQRIEVAAKIFVLSPSGDRLAYSSNDGNAIYVYKKNAEGEFKEQHSYYFENFDTRGIALPPDDNNQLAIWGWEPSYNLSYWLDNGKKKLLNQSLAMGAAYNHSGSRLATIAYSDGYDPKIFIWDSKTAKKLHCITLGNEKPDLYAADDMEMQYNSDMLMVSWYYNKVYKTLAIRDHEDANDGMKCTMSREFKKGLVDGMTTSKGNVILGYGKCKKGKNFVQLASLCNLSLKTIPIPEEPGMLELLDDSGSGPWYLYNYNKKERVTNVWQLDREKGTAEKVGSVPWHKCFYLNQDDGETLVGKDKEKLTIYKVAKQ